MGNPKSNNRDRPVGRGAANNGLPAAPAAKPLEPGAPGYHPSYNGPGMRGTIRKLITEKGFGFIFGENGKEYFFHKSELNGVYFDQLNEGDRVVFTAAQTVKGPRAQSISADVIE